MLNVFVTMIAFTISQAGQNLFDEVWVRINFKNSITDKPNCEIHKISRQLNVQTPKICFLILN
jgi:hypothetical protein